jgi:hypothetical protein
MAPSCGSKSLIVQDYLQSGGQVKETTGLAAEGSTNIHGPERRKFLELEHRAHLSLQERNTAISNCQSWNMKCLLQVYVLDV